LVQERNLHFAFGDFDDHLEDVSCCFVFARLAKKQSMSSLMTCLGPPAAV